MRSFHATAAAIMTARKNGSMASRPCIVSVNVGCCPRMCMGKKFQSASVQRVQHEHDRHKTHDSP